MFRFFKYIIIFIAGYKLIKMIWEGFHQEDKEINQAPSRQTIYQNQQQQTQQQATSNSKFNDAELIDYEEVK
ncbi:MAG: hypothetical protein R2739_05025 [Chitinophagales bacterium]|nr:hypothetical protein [Bacteroidota bacterium]